MKRKIRRTLGDKIFDCCNIVFMLLISFITMYPIWYVLIISLNDGKDAMLGGIYFLPRVFSLQNYATVFQNSDIITSFLVSASRTVIGTVTSVFFTAMVAYAFSKKYLVGHRLYMIMGLITLFFSGGLIPTFLVMRGLGLYDNYLIFILPSMFNFFNLLIFQSFFRNIPQSLEESAKIDGANEIVIFLKIIVPLSTPVLAAIALFNGVAQWNDFFTGVLYINNPALMPIQSFLYKIIVQNESQNLLNKIPGSAAGIRTLSVTSESIKMATMIITTMPIVFVYPFLQKYFVKGMLLGAVKG